MNNSKMGDNKSTDSINGILVHDNIDPSLVYREGCHNQQERQEIPTCIAVRLGQEAVQQQNFNASWSPSLPASGSSYANNELSLDYTLDKYPTESLFHQLSGFNSDNGLSFGYIHSPESENLNNIFQGIGANQNHLVQNSNSMTLTADEVSSTAHYTSVKSPHYWTDNGTIQTPWSENTADTRESSSSLDHSTQHQGIHGQQEIFDPLPLSNTEQDDNNPKITNSLNQSITSEKEASLPSWDPTVSKNHGSSPPPGCGVLDFSGTLKWKTETVKREKRKKSSSVRRETNSKKRAQHGAICVRCKLFRERCYGGYPCARCQRLAGSNWSSICVRANLTELNCYGKSLFGNRLHFHLNNVREWYKKPAFKPVQIMVSAGYKPTLELTVYKFVPINASLLDHISWRLHSDNELIRTPSSPWGLYDVLLDEKQINRFMDEMAEELLEEAAMQQKDAIWIHTFRIALDGSRDNKPGAELLRNSLRMWVAQSLWFNRIWRVTAEGERIDAPWRDSIKARDVPKLLYMQLDYSMEGYIANLERKILADLKSFVFKRLSCTWLPVYAAAFVYLVALENDSWRLETWKSKLKAWDKLHPAIRQNLPVWPLEEGPDYYLGQNKQYAHIIAAHVRAVCKGLFPFSRDESGQIVANTNSTDTEIKMFAEDIQEAFSSFCQNMMLRGAAPRFRPEDVNSLDYIFVSNLLMDNE